MASARNLGSYRYFECLSTGWRFFLCKAATMTGAKRPYHYLGELFGSKGFERLKIVSKKAFPEQCRFVQEYFSNLIDASGVGESDARMGMNKLFYVFCQSPEQREEWEKNQALAMMQQQSMMQQQQQQPQPQQQIQLYQQPFFQMPLDDNQRYQEEFVKEEQVEEANQTDDDMDPFRFLDLEGAY